MDVLARMNEDSAFRAATLTEARQIVHQLVTFPDPRDRGDQRAGDRSRVQPRRLVRRRHHG